MSGFLEFPCVVARGRWKPFASRRGVPENSSSSDRRASTRGGLGKDACLRLVSARVVVDPVIRKNACGPRIAVAIGTTIADRPPGGQGRSPAPGLPRIVACCFPAPRSSEVASQCSDSLQLPVGEIQLWPQQRKLLLDPLECLPADLAFLTSAAQHRGS